MKKIILFTFIFTIFLLFGCSIATEDSIEGTWDVTNDFDNQITSSQDYYKFNSDGTFYRDTDKDLLVKPVFDNSGKVITSQSPAAFGSYTLENGYLNIEFSSRCYYALHQDISVDAKYSGTTMYWYMKGIEKARLSKEN